MEAWCIGALCGLLVAVPPGPLGALCAQRSLRAGARAGLGCGLAIALGDAGHAALACCAPFDPCAEPGTARRIAALGAAVVLFVMGWRELRRRRAVPDAGRAGALRPAGVFLLALATPGTLPAYLLLFSSFGVQGRPEAALGATLAGLAWWSLVVAGSTLLREQAAQVLGWVERACGWLMWLGALGAARVVFA